MNTIGVLMTVQSLLIGKCETNGIGSVQPYLVEELIRVLLKQQKVTMVLTSLKVSGMRGRNYV